MSNFALFDFCASALGARILRLLSGKRLLTGGFQALRNNLSDLGLLTATISLVPVLVRAFVV